MQKFIQKIIGFSLTNKLFILLATLGLCTWGIIAFRNIPIEAFPDVTNTQITIITQWPGRSAEEVEKFVTLPIEVALNPVQKKTSIRSTTVFGLSVVKLIFDDQVEDAFARQQVNNLLPSVDFPEGATPQVQPPTGPTGEIFRYTLKSKSVPVQELKTLQDWVVERQLLGVPGVGDVVSFGGEIKTFEIKVDPKKLASFNLTPLDVFSAVSKSNINVGGDVIVNNAQAYVVRGIGLINNVEEAGNIIITQINEWPLLVKDVATVEINHLPRLGQVGRDEENDVVQGIIVMRKNENPSEVIRLVENKIRYINEKLLPEDVEIDTFYNRNDLIHFATGTVLHNMAEGILLVTVIVLVFMADWRTTVIVALIIPLSLLFAFICLRWRGMSANLLSMGAIDFGIIIDGAVVMVEGIFVAMDHRRQSIGDAAFNKLAKGGIIKQTGAEMGKAIFFSKLIIIAGLLPIFSFEKVEGKMFSPLAWTLGFALLGALVLTLTLVPFLCHVLLRKNVKEKHVRPVEWLTRQALRLFGWCFRMRKVTVPASIGLVAFGFSLFASLGSEFLPELDEGAIYIRATCPLSISLGESRLLANKMRKEILAFPEVKQVMSQTGRPNDGTDATGFYNIELHVDIHPKKEWKSRWSKEQLIDHMNEALAKFPGVDLNFSQPIMDNVEEAVSGVKGSLCVKIFGDSLRYTEQKANDVRGILANIRGVEDLGLIRNIGQPEIQIDLDQNKMAMYGVQTADANAIIEMAIGGKAISQIYEGNRKFQLRIRYEEKFRSTTDAIGELLVPSIHGGQIPVRTIASIKKITGPSIIFHDDSERYSAVKFSVRGRDMGGTIREAQAVVSDSVQLQKGYEIRWAGDFENQQRATDRLKQVVPISLALIFLILYVLFGNMRDASLALLNVPFAIIGGIAALLITNTHFSISAGIGFIALFGICIQNGVILISTFKKDMDRKGLYESIVSGLTSRVRPVLMTAMMAAIGLLPAAVSTGIGSETSKPLAIVVIGGLMSATVLTLTIFPLLFHFAYRKTMAKLGHGDRH